MRGLPASSPDPAPEPLLPCCPLGAPLLSPMRWCRQQAPVDRRRQHFLPVCEPPVCWDQPDEPRPVLPLRRRQAPVPWCDGGRAARAGGAGSAGRAVPGEGAGARPPRELVAEAVPPAVAGALDHVDLRLQRPGARLCLRGKQPDRHVDGDLRRRLAVPEPFLGSRRPLGFARRSTRGQIAQAAHVEYAAAASGNCHGGPRARRPLVPASRLGSAGAGHPPPPPPPPPPSP